jgi:hypothetical protein
MKTKMERKTEDRESERRKKKKESNENFKQYSLKSIGSFPQSFALFSLF